MAGCAESRFVLAAFSGPANCTNRRDVSVKIESAARRLTGSRHWVAWTMLCLLSGAAFVVAVAIRRPFSSEVLRQRVVGALANALDSDVTLASLTMHGYPGLDAVGEGLVVRHHGRTDVPPLLVVQRFTVSANVRSLLRRRVDRVILQGLEINVPPIGTAPARRSSEATVAPPPAKTIWNPLRRLTTFAQGLTIDEILAPETTMTLFRRDPTKDPRIWHLHDVRLRDVLAGGTMRFESLLTNAVPPGQVSTSGTFGPWQREDPGASAIEGRFVFNNADLSVFKGISGILSANGSFNGSLGRISVDGQTETPDFMVNISRHAVPLSATYHAVVDATNGNTTLDPVRATFLNTSLVARGGVYDAPGRAGHVVRLSAEMVDGRIEDIMRVTMNTPNPPMTGRLVLRTRLVIPPGKVDVVDKLELAGQFSIARGRFTNRGVQNQINGLSRIARGRRADADGRTTQVSTDFEGRFALTKGHVDLRSVSFNVPGALVTISGGYAVRSEALAFDGNLYMDAKLSETVTGLKSWLLKLADPLFRKHGRTVVPLRIDGTRSAPHFGLDIKRVFRPGKAQ